MEVINQLDFVRNHLAKMNTKQRTKLAAESSVSLRTLYRILEPASKPSHDSVHNIFIALTDTKPARGKK